MPADAPGRITVPSTPELQGLGAEITLAAWIKVRGTSHTQGLLTKTNQFGLLYGMDPAKSAGSLLFSFSGTNSTPEQIPLRTWTHVAATAKAGIVRYYVNGQPSGQGTYAKASY